MSKSKLFKDSDGLGRPWIILIIILSVLVVAGMGYYLGKNQAEKNAKAKYSVQIQSLQNDLDKAKSTVSNEATEGQQTVESLQAENQQLKTKVSDQDKEIDSLEKKVDDLEKQLEEANSNTNTPPTQ